MKRRTKSWIKCVVIPLAVGGAAGFLSMGGMKAFQLLKQPPLSPPQWLFPIVWTILYVVMGLASCKIKHADAPQQERNDALTIYWAQLVVNFLWPIFFFDFQWRLFSFFWLLFLWLLVYKMIRAFSGISKDAAKYCVPYLVWLTFAAYLNLGVWWLNR